MTDHFCSACGESVEPGAHFCASCGHPLGGPVAVEPAPPGGDPPRRKRRNLLFGAVAVIVVIGLAVGITLFLTRSSDQTGEIFLESAGFTGADPFTDSTVTGTGTSTTTTIAPTATGTSTTVSPTTAAGGPTVVGTVGGDTAGLYGGTMDAASCDRERQIAFLQANPDKARAFATVLGISTDQIPEYIRGLTPVVLRHDTRVTNHGFVDGAATAFQAVLQAGTAVLVDEFGIPRVRCMCGNPLLPPNAIEGDVRYQGQSWPGFSLDQTVVVHNDTDIAIDTFVLVDLSTGAWYDRPTGTDGSDDRSHDGGGGTTTGGGGPGLCADTYEGAVNRLLEFRRNNDRAGAGLCGSPVVLDYLWRLTDAFAATLTITGCEEGNKGLLPANIQGYGCSMSNNAIFVVELVPQGPRNWIVSFVALVDGQSTMTSPPPGTEAECGSSRESFEPGTADERVLVTYFQALNDEDFATAWGLMGDRLRSVYGSEQDFANLMSTHLSCVRVLAISSYGNGVYAVEFAVKYDVPFPAGGGQLQPFWTVVGGRVVDAATSP